MKTRNILLTVGLTLLSLTAMSQKSFDVKLWNNKMPNSNGDEKDVPELKVFLPAEGKATGRAVVLCPGGAYRRLCMDYEGTDWAPFFNNMGIAAIVLKYRLPNTNPLVPLSDAEEALRLVRRNAKAWHINPSDVGIMGSSAGGHLAATVATKGKGEAKPDFQILFYPVITMIPAYTNLTTHNYLLGEKAKKKDEQLYSADMHVTRVTPRAFIVLSDDDQVVLPINGVNYYTELYRHDVPASLFVFPDGGHGFGIKPSFKYHAEMLLNLRAWLNSF